MPHGYPQSKKESQGVENEITALVFETRNTGLFQLVLLSGFCIVVGMISDVSVEGKTRLAMLPTFSKIQSALARSASGNSVGAGG